MTRWAHPGRPARTRRDGVPAAAVSLLVAALGLAFASGPGIAVAAAESTCVRTPGRLTVAVVVDGGDAPPRVDCVTVDQGATGADVLAARAVSIGAPAPRYDSSGLLCGIDDVPISGCGEPTGDGAYRYWSYWWPDGSGWQYARSGPATHTVTDGSVEGWRFISGRGTDIDNAPTVSPDTVHFVDAAEPTTSVANVNDPPPTVPPTPPDGGGDGGPATGSGAGAAGTSRATGPWRPDDTTGAGRSPAGDGAWQQPGDVTTTSPASDPSLPDTTSSTTGASPVAPDDGAASGSETEVAGVAVVRDRPAGGTTTVGTFVSGGLAVGALGVAVAITLRRRRST